MAYPAFDGIKVFAIRKGRCWAIVGNTAPVLVEEGNILVIAGLSTFRVCSDPKAACVPALPYLAAISPGGIGKLGSGGGCSGTGGYFTLREDVPFRVTCDLPDKFVFRSGRDVSLVSELIDRLAEEIRHPQPGGDLFCAHLAQCLLIATLRAVMGDQEAAVPGMLTGLRDRRIKGAITAIHDKPQRHWTLQDLAETAGMSRTAFANNFRNLVGETPFRYLTRWRVAKAVERLRTETVTIAQLAHDFGYSSESAFGAAFKRITGVSPKRSMSFTKHDHPLSPM